MENGLSSIPDTVPWKRVPPVFPTQLHGRRHSRIPNTMLCFVISSCLKIRPHVWSSVKWLSSSETKSGESESEFQLPQNQDITKGSQQVPSLSSHTEGVSCSVASPPWFQVWRSDWKSYPHSQGKPILNTELSPNKAEEKMSVRCSWHSRNQWLPRPHKGRARNWAISGLLLQRKHSCLPVSLVSQSLTLVREIAFSL